MIELAPWIHRVEPGNLILSNDVGDWCRLPYPNHPKGCPKYGQSEGCPPRAPKVENVFDLSKPLFLINSEFDLAAHVERMRLAHPEWSDRQLRNVLYWQGTSRKQLKKRVKQAAELVGADTFAMVPEAMGVNVYATAMLSGLKLERIKGLKTCRHVALIGTKVRSKDDRS